MFLHFIHTVKVSNYLYMIIFRSIKVVITAKEILKLSSQNHMIWYAEKVWLDSSEMLVEYDQWVFHSFLTSFFFQMKYIYLSAKVRSCWGIRRSVRWGNFEQRTVTHNRDLTQTVHSFFFLSNWRFYAADFAQIWCVYYWNNAESYSVEKSWVTKE